MPTISGISTFSVALPPNPTVAIDESSRISEAGSGCNLIRPPLSPCLAQGSPTQVTDYVPCPQNQKLRDCFLVAKFAIYTCAKMDVIFPTIVGSKYFKL